MNNPIILKKLESLTRCLSRIEQKRPHSLDILTTDHDLQDIISVNLERSIQISVDIAAIIISEKGYETSNTMAGCFKVLQTEGVLPTELSEKLQKSIGFRNISVHEYQSIDWKIVYDVIHNHLSNFREFIKIVLEQNNPSAPQK